MFSRPYAFRLARSHHARLYSARSRSIRHISYQDLNNGWQRLLRYVSSTTAFVGLAVAAHFTSQPQFLLADTLSTNLRKPCGERSTCTLEEQPGAVYDLSEPNVKDAERELVELLGESRVITTLSERINRSSTEWSAAPNGAEDRCSFVVLPESTEEVSAIAKICHRRRIPIIPFSGGTSLEGMLAATTQGGCCIDFKLMNSILAIHDKDLDVVCQPGVGYQDLNQQLEKLGLYFPPDPGPGAQIGGMIGTGCSGTKSYRYGTMKDWVLGLTVVLADGTVVKTRQRPRKSSAGYNLTQLMVGSEGTLAIVTEANLKVTGAPRNMRVGYVSFPSTNDAVETVVNIVQADMQLNAMEFIDALGMRAVNNGGYVEGEFQERPHLFFKFAGHSEAMVADQIARTTELAAKNGGDDFTFATSVKENDALWEARKTILWSLFTLKKKPEDGFISTDTAVPISKIPALLAKMNHMCQGTDFIVSVIGHVGDGNFHTAIFYDQQQKSQARDLLSRMQLLAIEMEGTITGEHGIGLEYRDMLVNENGPQFIDMMRQVKLALDPLCLLNPDKLFRIKWSKDGEEGRNR